MRKYTLIIKNAFETKERDFEALSDEKAREVGMQARKDRQCPHTVIIVRARPNSNQNDYRLVDTCYFVNKFSVSADKSFSY